MVNNETIALIEEFEGVELTAYPDPGSSNGLPWTIGYGHTNGVKQGDVITKAQALQFLREDLVRSEAVVRKYVKVPLNENQYGAIVSFVENLGEYQFKKSSVLAFINAGKFNSVPGRMALYRNNDGKVMAGLVRRRTAEGALWMKPVGVSSPIVESGVQATAATPNKPWDWGVAGMVLTMISSASDDVKNLIGNFTETFGINPIYILIAVALGFGAWTIYNKWKVK